MSLFRHPHLVRGIVHTAAGAFAIHRGVVKLPAHVGETLGWQRLDDDDGEPLSARTASWSGRHEPKDHRSDAP